MRRRGFTLIEVMISLALLTTFFGISLLRTAFVSLREESDYRFAVRNARFQMARLRLEDYSRLPPERLKLGPGGWVQLAHYPLVPNTVDVTGGKLLEVDWVAGRVKVASESDSITVNYSYYPSDEGEAHTVPNQAPYEVSLHNAPVVQVVRVWRAAGDRLIPLSGLKLQCRGSRLTLPSSQAGQVVVVDYLGTRVRGQISGHFLNENLGKTNQAGPFKEMLLTQSYGSSRQPRFRLSLVRGESR